MTCSVAGCVRSVHLRGYCRCHYLRVIRTGSPQADKPIRTRVVRDQITVTGAHLRVRYLWGSASRYPCVACGKQARDWAYDGTDSSQLYEAHHGSRLFYSTYPEFYMPMCRSCHAKRDRTILFHEVEEYRTLKHETGLSSAEIRAIIEKALESKN